MHIIVSLTVSKSKRLIGKGVAQAFQQYAVFDALFVRHQIS